MEKVSSSNTYVFAILTLLFFPCVVEFVLSCVKIAAIIGFIIFGIVVNTGGVPTDDRGYIGFRFWNGENGNYAFRNGTSRISSREDCVDI